VKSITPSLLSSILLLISSISISPQVLAQPIVAVGDSSVTIAAALNPADLVGVAYQGLIPGIPGHAGLMTAYISRRISAKDIIRAAVEDQRVSASMLQDSKYIANVDHLLHLRLHPR
jgi:hypothetical protein